MLEQLEIINAKTPKVGWGNLRIYAYHGHDEILKNNRVFFGDFRKRAYQFRVKKEELQAKPFDYLYFSKMSKFKLVDMYKKDKNANLIYSQWRGYLKCSNDQYFGAEETAAYQKDPQVNLVYAHTNGHATVEDLKRFAAADKSNEMLVPIHTEYRKNFKEYFGKLMILDDKCLFSI